MFYALKTTLSSNRIPTKRYPFLAQCLSPQGIKLCSRIIANAQDWTISANSDGWIFVCSVKHKIYFFDKKTHSSWMIKNLFSLTNCQDQSYIFQIYKSDQFIGSSQNSPTGEKNESNFLSFPKKVVSLCWCLLASNCVLIFIKLSSQLWPSMKTNF